MLNKIKNWLNNNGWFVFIISTLPILTATTVELLQPHPFSFDTSHSYFFMCIILLSFKFMYDTTLTYYQIFVVILLQTIISISQQYEALAAWITTYSPVAFLFAQLPATGGADLISSILIITNTLILTGMIIYQKVKHNKFNLNRFFFVLGTGTFIITTLLFHWVTIEMGYRGYEKIEQAKIIKALLVNRDQHFHIICDYQGYNCTTKGQTEILKMVKKEESEIIKSIPKNYEWVKNIGNFGEYRYTADRKRIGIFKHKDRWLIDYTHFEGEWVKSSEKFFLLCSVAHIFWAYFTVFLIVSHNRRIQRKKEMNNIIDTQ